MDAEFAKQCLMVEKIAGQTGALANIMLGAQFARAALTSRQI